MTIAVLGAALMLSALALLRALWRLRRAEAGAAAATRELIGLRAELQQCQRLLGHADRLSAVGMLAASVAHEVRNSLVSVRTFAQLLPERLHDEEFRTTFRELALTEIDRIGVLVNDLLACARPSADTIEPVDVGDTLAQLCRLVEIEAKQRGIVIRAVFPPPLPRISIDQGLIKQVFLNVLLNAIHACDAEGHITLATRTIRDLDASFLQVEVCDSGRGIPAADLERIFDPFFTTKEGGSGLGLFIARRIVGDHGGVIEVDSTPGKGTAVRVNFPLPSGGAPVEPRTDLKDDAYGLHHRSVTHG
jgi:signal transduction histidine kinase